MSANTLNNNRIMFIYPPVSKLERYSSEIGSAGGSQIPLGIYYLASFIRQNGFGVQVCDGEALNLTAPEILARINDFAPRYIGISSTTVAFHRAYELAALIRKELPDTIVIIGGPHVTSNPGHAMADRLFDYGVTGEGEITLLELLNTLNNNADVSEIKGITYFGSDGQLIVNPSREYNSDLDTLPFPAYDLIEDISLYFPPPSNYKTLPVVNIITSRGCPSMCTFCDKNVFGSKFRRRSARNIADEIVFLRQTYGIREIAFVDDTLFVDKKRIYELFDILDALKIHFHWTCMSRINNVDPEFLKFVHSKGCWHISFGIESGNEEILKRIRKNIKPGKAEEVVSWCSKTGIKTKGFFIIGHPGETLQTIEETIRFACRLRLDDIVVTLNTPIPGSQQYAEASLYGTLDNTDWTQYNYWRPVFIPEGLTKEILLSKHREIYHRFYLRPRILWRYFISFFGKGGGKRLIAILLASRFLFSKKKK